MATAPILPAPAKSLLTGQLGVNSFNDLLQTQLAASSQLNRQMDNFSQQQVVSAQGVEQVAGSAESIRMPDEDRSAMRQRLEDAANLVLSNLDFRLYITETQEIVAERPRRAALLEQKYTQQSKAIMDDELSDNFGLGADFGGQVVNLRAKIAALTMNVQPPPTAPAGYWAERLQVRDAELDKLLGLQMAAVQKAQSSRDSALSDLRSKLTADSTSDMEQFVLTLDSQRSETVKEAGKRLNSEIDSMIATAGRLPGSSAWTENADYQASFSPNSELQAQMLAIQKSQTALLLVESKYIADADRRFMRNRIVVRQ